MIDHLGKEEFNMEKDEKLEQASETTEAKKGAIPQELIDRINELSKKKKEGTLTEAEKEEQQELRKTLQEKLMKRRQELIEPIQKKALAAIDRAAKAQGVTVVLDQQVIVSGGKDLTNDAAAEISK